MYNVPDFGLYTHEWIIVAICLITIKFRNKIFNNNKLALGLMATILIIFFTEKYNMIKYLFYIPNYVKTIIPIFVLVVLLDSLILFLYYIKINNFKIPHVFKNDVIKYLYHVYFNFFLMISLTTTLYGSGHLTVWILSWIMIIKSFYITNVIFNYITWGWIANLYYEINHMENRPRYYLVKRW